MRAAVIVLCILSAYLCVLAMGLFYRSAFENIFLKPIVAYDQIVNQMRLLNKSHPEFFYAPARSNAKGVSVHDPARSYGDYTFYIGIEKQAPKLIDMEGNIVHRWSVDHRAIWPDKSHVSYQIPERLHTSSRAYLNPDTGDVFMMYGGYGITPGIFGLVKLNKDSEVQWVYEKDPHHDIEIDPDGRIYVLGRDVRQQADEDFPNILPPFMNETLVVLDENGQEIKTLSFIDMFKNSALRILLEKVSHIPEDPTMPAGDLFHANTIERVPDTAVGRAPMLKRGHLMVSLRNWNLLLMVDPDEEEITWASYGPWHGQHHTEIQNDGSVFMFDNMGHLEGGGASRILQVDLNDLGMIWGYGGSQEQPFFSAYNSMIDVLPNGNVLATSSHAGRIFEVSPDKEIVWEFWNPARTDIHDDGIEDIAAVFSGTRYRKEDLRFLDAESRN